MIFGYIISLNAKLLRKTDMAKITIIGAGMMGSAMSVPASYNNNTVRIVGTPLDDDIISEASKTGYHITLKRNLPKSNEYYHYSDLDKVLNDSDCIICGVSSFGVEWFSDNVLPRLDENIPVLSITKGLKIDENGNMISFSDFYSKNHPNKHFSLNCVGGPCTSYELVDKHNTEVAFCGENIVDLDFFKSILQTPYYHISLTTDVIGLETAVALKNAYALGVSLAIGMAEKNQTEDSVPDYNAQAGLFYQAVKEMSKLIALNGGESDKISFGAGDLFVTVFGGRTRKIGTLLGKGIKYSQAKEMLKGITLESIAITKLVTESLTRTNVGAKDFPLLFHIKSLIEEKQEEIPWNLFTE